MSSRLRQGIYELLSAVEIDTKEEGRCHVEPWMSQRMVIDAVADGLENDVHEFVILKSRQVAITTVASVIELFWALANEGTQGAIIADRTDNLERLRRIFATLLETLPRQWRGPEHRIITNNRNGLVFANRSTIDLMAAANNPDLGASRALNMAHCTECGTWKSIAGVESLRASLAQLNPNRLYIFESIANGFNWWWSHCQRAKQDRHMKFIFCGFWSNPTYAIPRDHPDYRIYWDGHLTDDEVKRARLVRQEYGVTITPEQIAWYRKEAEFRAEEYLWRHYPWHEKECFIASGSHFFPAQRTLEIGEALAAGAPFKGYRYIFDERFLSSRIEQVTNSDDAMLRVWEPPADNGVYAIGIDPSGGGSDEADDHAIEVLRCYADRVVQVCEFQSHDPLTYQLAWVLCHLAGAYRNHMANLEITGIGAAVMPEVRNLRQLAERGIIQGNPNSTDKIIDVIGNVRWFLYSRVDSFGGAGNINNWKANADNTAMIYSELRDSLMLGRLELRSPRLLLQMQAVVEDEGWIGAGPDTGEHDDLVDALALSHHTWVKWHRDGLLARGLTWKSVNEKPPADPGTVLSFAFSHHFQKIHVQARRRHEQF